MSPAVVISLLSETLPKVISAVLAAEKAYRGAKQGVLKKKYVMDVVMGGLEAASEYSPLLANHKESIRLAVEEMLEASVKFLNATGVLGREYEFDLSDAT